MIEILSADRVPSSANTLVCRHSTGRAIVVAAGALVAGVGLLWAGYGRGSVPMTYVGTLSLLGLLIYRKLLLARFRASNWLVRLGRRGVFIQFRSYLNQHLSPDDPTVMFLPYGTIRLVRTRTERKVMPDRDTDDRRAARAAVETITWVEFEVRASTRALAQALDAEVARRPATGALYKDYPVRIASDGSIQVRWSVVPRADVLLEALRRHVPIDAPASADADYTNLEQLSTREQRQRIAALLRAGDTVTAVRWIRRLHGLSVTDAMALLDRLSAEGLDADLTASAAAERRSLSGVPCSRRD